MGCWCCVVLVVLVSLRCICFAEKIPEKCYFSGNETVGSITLVEKGDNGGTSYVVLDIPSATPVLFKDDDFRKLFNSNICGEFHDNISLPSSFIKGRLTEKIRVYVNCSPNDISGCSMYYKTNLPNDIEYSEPSDSSSLASLVVEYESLPDCKHCDVVKNDHRGLKVGLGVCGGFVTIMVLAAVIFVCHRRRRRTCLVPISASSSMEPAMKEDVELGIDGVPVFSYAELEAATGGFGEEYELGEGGFGVVYYGKLKDGREIAVKRMFEHSCRRVAQFMNEITILAKIRHKYLVSLYGCTSRRSRELLLVYEYVANGTVFDHLHGKWASQSRLTWRVRMNIAVETASALAYLHASDIIHRDVKTHNILLDDNFSVKVADFGLSRLFPFDRTHVSTAPQGTPGYVDPEYHQSYQLTDKSDVYSFGVVLIELVSSMTAVDITRDRSEINLAYLALKRVQNSAYDELIDRRLGYGTNEEVTKMTVAVADLAFRCVQADRCLRPTMMEVLEELLVIQNNATKTQSPPLSSAESPLLKNAMNPTSPTSVISKWTSDLTSAANSSNGFTLKDEGYN